jgi:hypothetical protein
LCCLLSVKAKTNGMNTLAYILYLLITYFITVHVGLRFFRNGRVYILRLMHGDEKFADFINRILLTGYYLLNLGYAAVMIRFWKTLTTWEEVFTSIASMTGKIMLTLAVIHFLNMAAILLISQRHHPIVNNKNSDI